MGRQHYEHPKAGNATVLVARRQTDGARFYVGATVDGDWLLVPVVLAAYPFREPGAATRFARLFAAKPGMLGSHGCEFFEVQT